MLTWSWLCSGRGYALFHQICISSPQPTGSKEVSTYEHQTNMSSTTKTSQRAYLTEFNMRIITMSINGPQHIIDRPPYIGYTFLMPYLGLEDQKFVVCIAIFFASDAERACME